MTEQTALKISGILNVAIPVSDHERAIEFYVGTLGFEKRRDAPFGSGMRWVEVAAPGSVTTIALAPPHGRATGIDTGIRLGTADVDAIHADLAGRGVDVDAVMRFGAGVPPMFFFRDPDGNTLVMVEDHES
ncbi:MAG: VOC family protein [Candidatus Dormibacteraeota bacterium]|nr:VOC family protein [Candidatus Dormibacteraeota bacterium]